MIVLEDGITCSLSTDCPFPPWWKDNIPWGSGMQSASRLNHVGHQVKFGHGYPNVPGQPCVCSVCWFLAFLNINCSIVTHYKVCSEIFRACFCSAKLCAKMCSDKKFLKLGMTSIKARQLV